MVYKNILRIIILTMLICIAQTSHAKDYIVEMIFFVDTHGGNSVHISTDPVIPDLSGAIILNDKAVSQGFIPYPREALFLENQANALSKSGRYKVIKHLAWLQPGLAREEAIPVRIHAGKNYSDEFQERSFAQTTFSDQTENIKHPVNELDGTIKVVLGRYLHVYTDLAYRKPYDVNRTSLNNALGKERVLADFAIKSHRKMRSKTLHYIDHPVLGILVEIRAADS